MAQEGALVTFFVEDCCFEYMERFIDLVLERFPFLPRFRCISPSSLSFQSAFDNCVFVIYVEKVGFASDEHAYNMRGDDVSAFCNAKLSANPPLRSFGVGDGGNEVGCGKYRFEHIQPKHIHCA